MDKKIISLIGLGEVGATTASLLFSNYTHTIFNLMDIDMDNIHGRLLDLKHAAAVRNNTIIVNSDQLLSQSEIIIYAAGYSNSAGMDRNSVATHNKKIVHQVFEQKVLLKTSTIIVVTNPVELVSYWISKIFNHKILVIGTGTSLDSFRLQYLLSEHFAVDIDAIDALVLGEHGKHMIPIFSKCQCSNQAINTLLSKEEKKKVLINLKSSATAIRATESATKYGVSECVNIIVEFLLKKEKTKQLPLSIKINPFYKELLQIQEDIFMSLPCEIMKSQINIMDTLDYNTTELAELREAARALALLHTQLT